MAVLKPFAQHEIDSLSLIKNHEPITVSKHYDFFSLSMNTQFADTVRKVGTILVVWSGLVIGADRSETLRQLPLRLPQHQLDCPTIVSHSSKRVIEIHILVESVLPENVFDVFRVVIVWVQLHPLDEEDV